MQLSNERLLKLYRDMYLVRVFEDVAGEYAANGTIPGFVHLSTGQEACAAGICDCLRKDDYKFPDHRGHGEALLVGSDPKLVMAEIFGKRTGINGGRGGSMHISDWNVHNHGFNGIQGSTMVTALGTAFATKYRKKDDVTVIFFGDGTLGEGSCHESMNMAATWHLPIVYCLFNNGYAISTRCEDAHPQKELIEWAQGYEVPAVRIDGNDVEAVVEATEKAVEACRKGEGPYFIELVTYRWQGHFAGDPAAYRPDDEVAYWKDRDPVKKTRKDLIDRGVSVEEVEALEAEVKAQIDDMLKFSLESPIPEPEDALTNVYAKEVQ